jgi:hypothetical protein
MSQRSRPFFRVLVVFTSLLFVLACSSEADVGADCDEAGKTKDQCVDGAICAKNKGGDLICQKLCNEQADCEKEENCEGIEGTNQKSCRPE